MLSNVKHPGNPNKNFTQIHNAIFVDKDLSADARIVYCKICSVPRYNFVVSVAGLADFLKICRKRVMDALKELEEHGYIKREKQFREDGRRTYDEYTIYHDPKGLLNEELRRERGFRAVMRLNGLNEDTIERLITEAALCGDRGDAYDNAWVEDEDDEPF